MKLRTGVTALLITLCLAGCSATEPVVWKADNVSFTGFKAFEIQPVFNATEKTINQDTLSFFDVYLKEQFEVQNLQLIDNPQTKSGVLIVKTEILVYYTSQAVPIRAVGSSRKAKCKLRTRLVDKSTGKVVAKIQTIIEVGIGQIGSETHLLVMKRSAESVAKEVAKIMQPIETR